MKASRIVLLATGVAAIAFAAAPAFAHHSFAMFDNQKAVTLEGTVKDFQWTNPHVWIQIAVPNAAAKEVEWSIELGSVSTLSRQGWKRTSLKPGDKAVVVIHPLRDGSSGGSMMTVSVNGAKVGGNGVKLTPGG